MAKIISNKAIAPDTFLMEVQGKFKGRMGQFYMLRAWSFYPLLSRPISIHDIDNDSISFLYRVAGEGTKLLSQLKPGEELHLEGPFGVGYPMPQGRVALAGGGIGIAPLYLAAKELSRKGIEDLCVYLGFKEEGFLVESFQRIASNVKVKLGGNVTELIDPSKYDYILTCGPDLMMQEIYKKANATSTKVYVSIERHMACGIGACLVCTCETKNGNKKVCKDGPVFLGEEVYHG
jgi:dihydroorotate dehydrogenase electron transfer subunit